MATVYIGDKLDFLMKLTDTGNNSLAKALNFDSSHISRIRSGQRGLPKQKSFLEPASEFFARKIKEPFQKKGAEDVICPGRSWPGKPAAQAALIAKWLSSGSVDRPFFSGNGGDAGKPEGAKEETVTSTGVFYGASEPLRTANVFYYGNEGRRRSALRFLDEVLEQPYPTALMLYSDEDMSWLTENPAYTGQWRDRMLRVLKKGCSITMVHNITRNIGEMLDAIRSWTPLYMTGRIDPWFCTKLRDGVFRQTRYVASGTAAVIGGSMGNAPLNSASIYIEDAEMVKNLEQEFRSLLEFCRPLMRIYHAGSNETLAEDVGQFERMAGELRAKEDTGMGVLFVKESAALLFSPPAAGTVFAVKEQALVRGLGETLSQQDALCGEDALSLFRTCKKTFGIG